MDANNVETVVGKVFSAVTDAVRAGVHAGQQVQAAWMEAASRGWGARFDGAPWQSGAERTTGAVKALVERNTELFRSSVERSTKAGLESFRAGCEACGTEDAGSFVERSQKLWDITGRSVAAQLDIVGAAGVGMLNHWVETVGTALTPGKEPKSAAKPTKA